MAAWQIINFLLATGGEVSQLSGMDTNHTMNQTEILASHEAAILNHEAKIATLRVKLGHPTISDTVRRCYLATIADVEANLAARRRSLARDLAAAATLRATVSCIRADVASVAASRDSRACRSVYVAADAISRANPTDADLRADAQSRFLEFVRAETKALELAREHVAAGQAVNAAIRAEKALP